MAVFVFVFGFGFVLGDGFRPEQFFWRSHLCSYRAN
jgi:hypothetical protein